jgi:hypothetical protein
MSEFAIECSACKKRIVTYEADFVLRGLESPILPACF